MFEEQPKPTQAPPVDIFKDVDSQPIAAASSKMSSIPPMADRSPTKPPSKIIFLIVLVLVLGLIGLGVFLLIKKYSSKDSKVNANMANSSLNQAPINTSPLPSTDSTTPKLDLNSSAPTITNQPDSAVNANTSTNSSAPNLNAPDSNSSVNLNATNTNSNDVVTPPPTDSTVPAKPLDSDGDNLSDQEESGYGTNAQLVDTDSDGLTDGEEINVYKSDPLKVDTDNDGFSDGQEVKNGYNPTGPGRLFNVPK